MGLVYQVLEGFEGRASEEGLFFACVVIFFRYIVDI